MWIVRLALRRPYTFAVVALLLMVLGPLAIVNMPVDIFPNINIPVVYHASGSYTGFSPEQMADRIVTLSERSLTTTVNDIEHIESNVAERHRSSSRSSSSRASISATRLRRSRPSPRPRSISCPREPRRRWSSSTTPPASPSFSLAFPGRASRRCSSTIIGLNFIRTQLVTVPGAGIPYPYGGKQRQVQVDLNLPALQSKGLSPADVVNAIGAQNLILPSGSIKIGQFEYQLETNSAPTTIQGLNDLPIRQVNGAMVYVHDVAHVRNGFPPQTNIVRVDGQRACPALDHQDGQCLHAQHRQRHSSPRRTASNLSSRRS